MSDGLLLFVVALALTIACSRAIGGTGTTVRIWLYIILGMALEFVALVILEVVTHIFWKAGWVPLWDEGIVPL